MNCTNTLQLPPRKKPRTKTKTKNAWYDTMYSYGYSNSNIYLYILYWCLIPKKKKNATYPFSPAVLSENEWALRQTMTTVTMAMNLSCRINTYTPPFIPYGPKRIAKIKHKPSEEESWKTRKKVHDWNRSPVGPGRYNAQRVTRISSHIMD